MRLSPRLRIVFALALLAALAATPLVLLADDHRGPAPLEQGAFAVIGLGFLLGIRHAFDADHLVAVSALVSERPDLRRAARIGALWGLGHTTSLVAVGLAVIFVRAPIPGGIARVLELAVGVMIVALGANLLIRLKREHGARISLESHSHGRISHTHLHIQTPDEAQRHRLPRRTPFLVGAFHGLAGSAALTLLVLAQIRTPALGLAYIALFGLGSVAGMAAMSSLFALPMTVLLRRFRSFDTALRLTAGTLSVGFGLYLVVEIGIVEGLLLGR
jgi:cytochrome c biogenesis protein CcdA